VGRIPPNFTFLHVVLEHDCSDRLWRNSNPIIELDNNQLIGMIPSEIENLGNFTLLFMWKNKLEGVISSSISNCHNLEAVDLSQNGLTGNIPKGIFELKNLVKLLLLSSNLSGQIPVEIGNCSCP
jgi:Leucine-rich repeat (LRR) protein